MRKRFAFSTGLMEVVETLENIVALVQAGRTGQIRLDVDEVWQIDDAFKGMQKACVEGPMMDVYDKLAPALNGMIVVLYAEQEIR